MIAGYEMICLFQVDFQKVTTLFFLKQASVNEEKYY